MIACRLRDKWARGEPIMIKNFVLDMIYKKWSPIRSVILQVINKIGQP